ncbi:MAG: putative peptidoglycan glycosyltransferase FtsW [Candidatus Peregrinibacteria bacterium]|nr:putative peptidoglycan glycosyltransferase FtsW [Candidatus Peregrinibacteria bacterium]
MARIRPRKSKKAKTGFFKAAQKPPHPVDHVLLITTFALLIFSLIMITSIGVPKSIRLSAPDILYPNCASDEVDCYLILKNHATRIGIGVIVFLTLMKVHYGFWKKISLWFFGLALGLLATVFFFGSDYNTFARSWLSLPNVPILQSVQPTEIAKLALIFYFANWLDRKQREKEIETFQGGFIAFCVVSGLIILPVVMQPDLGSTLVIAFIAVGMYFIAGASWRHIALGGTIALLVSSIMITNVDYLNKRFSAYLNPDEAACAEDYCWQSEQAKIAVGSGGIWGRGLTQGIQKSYWLPQASDDFIFAASAEEIGFIRVTMVVLAYCIILYRGLQIANYAPDPFARLTAAGITVWIVVQAFINIAVNIAIFPVTGITLPLVSYGGSSLVMSLVGMAVLLNISQYTQTRAYTPQWRRNSRPRLAAYRRR